MDLDDRYSSAVSRRPGPREHIRCDEGDVADYVLLPGDPGRAATIAEYLEDARHVASAREFTTYTGRLGDVGVTVTSTGIGGPSTAIAIEELVQLGARTLIRIGTCGAMRPDVHVGDLIIASASVRDEGTTRQYAPLEYPAVATPEVLQALTGAAATRGYTHHVGVVHTTDTFYGQHEPERMPVAAELGIRHDMYRGLGVLCSEMETATVFVVGGAALDCRVGSVLAVAGNRLGGEHLDSEQMVERRNTAVKDAITTALDAVRLLAAPDGSSRSAESRP